MAGTKFEKDAIQASAKKIGELLNDMSAFQDLKPHWPNAGSFSTAQWVERIVDDRRNGIVAHAERLKIIATNLQTNLNTIATNLDATDAENAARLKKMDTTIATQISTLDTNTENQQHNFSDGATPADKNGNDGDGYNDNNNGSVTGNDGSSSNTYSGDRVTTVDTPNPDLKPDPAATADPPEFTPTDTEIYNIVT